MPPFKLTVSWSAGVVEIANLGFQYNLNLACQDLDPWIECLVNSLMTPGVLWCPALIVSSAGLSTRTAALSASRRPLSPVNTRVAGIAGLFETETVYAGPERRWFLTRDGVTDWPRQSRPPGRAGKNAGSGPDQKRKTKSDPRPQRHQ